MAYFDGIKVGDRVYSLAFGFGRVDGIDLSDDDYPLWVNFLRDGQSFTMDGEYEKGELQTLFWDKPVFDPPQRPKRKVKKTIERWCFVNPVTGNLHSGLWSTQEAAVLARGYLPLSWNPVKLIGEYEVEE